ncbi:cobyrinate a,c-diamide synthase [Hydrocarboniclastica marina]|uniref:Cobyrinate a,c-diamide synthase n=1 Tax=Hydrocarboniclastica marina TaxID=2259620 RepID=A0A4P7XJV8_9ALTE|nr:cobyrinate a,c-diamide synthase [Hydrocarboniclastica marina]QCF27063.1 cobyrinate a,c-diamide synthase [Hydrocarboniclastica marina]
MALYHERRREQRHEQVGGRTAAALITAPGSGQGKSMVTAAMARLHRNAGRKVRVFKHGPDYLDPMVLEVASGAPVYQVHGWMTGDDEIRWRLAEAAQDADLILVEGSMGLFDGDPCSADLAVSCGIPALPVMDARAMGQTFGALALGLASYRPDVQVREVIANRVGSAYHAQLVRESLPPGISLLGAIPRSEAFAIPDRHLGLVQASELPDLDASLDAAAAVLVEAGLDQLPAQVDLSAAVPDAPPQLLAGRRIAIARDNAFAFIYRANLDLLQAMGAELVFFSPLADSTLPDADALWLPGGYPELHGATLAANAPLNSAIQAHHRANKPILAECGGLMACVETLQDGDGEEHAMLGLMPGRARMAGRLKGLGMQGMAGAGASAHEELRGHAYHHSELETSLAPVAHARKLRGTEGEAIYRCGSLTASYFHGYFPSAPQLVADLFNGHS